MRKDHFINILQELHTNLMAMTKTKGEEYSRDDDQLANFKRQGVQLGLRPEVVWFVYFNKHLDAIISYINSSSGATFALSEPIEGRIDDAILYLALLKAMVIEKKSSIIPPVPSQEDEA